MQIQSNEISIVNLGSKYQRKELEAQTNPQIGEKIFATRRRIKVDMEVAMKNDYSKFVYDLVIREYPDI